MFGFIVSVVLTLGAAAIAIVLAMANKEQDKKTSTDYFEDVGVWDFVTGKPFREMQRDIEARDLSRNWVIGLTCWAIASAGFTVYQGVKLFGG